MSAPSQTTPEATSISQMDDSEIRTHLDLAAADGSWMVFIARASNNRVRLFRKSQNFKVDDFEVIKHLVASDLDAEVERIREQNSEGKPVAAESVG